MTGHGFRFRIQAGESERAGGGGVVGRRRRHRQAIAAGEGAGGCLDEVDISAGELAKPEGEVAGERLVFGGAEDDSGDVLDDVAQRDLGATKEEAVSEGGRGLEEG
jgi:hypothetical protein